MDSFKWYVLGKEKGQIRVMHGPFPYLPIALLKMMEYSGQPGLEVTISDIRFASDIKEG